MIRKINASKHTLNISRSALSQNVLRTDQFKHSFLTHTGKARKQGIRLYVADTDQIGFYRFFLTFIKNKHVS